MTVHYPQDQIARMTPNGLMKISTARPPIWNKAHAAFDIDDKRTYYTYGNTLYNPAEQNITDEYIEHESIHMRQQREIGGPEIWWNRYIDDPQFRLNQELEAYGRQYWYWCRTQSDRNKRVKYLYQIIEVLLSPIYKIPRELIDGDIAIKNAIMRWANSHD